MKKYLLIIFCLVSMGSLGQEYERSADDIIFRIDSLDDLGLYAEALTELSFLKKQWPSTSFCKYGVLQGNLYNRTFKYDSALYSYQKVLDLCGGNMESVYAGMHGTAFTYRMTGILDSSAVWEYRALNLARSHDYKRGVNLSLQSLAILSYLRQEYEVSIRQAMELVDNIKENGEFSLLGNMYNIIGENFRKLSKLDSSRTFHLRALEVRRKSGDESRIASSLNNIATIYLERKEGSEAMPYLLQAKDIKEKYQDSASLVTLYTNIGTAYFQEKHWRQARTYFEKSALIASKIEFPEGGLTNLTALIQLDTVLGNYREAFHALSEYHQLSNTYLNEAKQKEMMELDKKYETEKREQDMLFKDRQLRARDQFILIISIATGGVFLLSLYLFVMLRKNKRLSFRNELLLKEQNHRVKNNLQMISSLLSLQSDKLLSSDAKDALENSQGRINSVALLHRMLYEGENVGNIEVNTYIRSLTEEIQYGAGREMEINLKLPEKLDMKIEKVISLGLIVNELLTNSIKHVDRAIMLQVEMTLLISNNSFHLTYRDNGPGVAQDAWMSSGSFGNQLVQIQSKQLQGEFKVSSDDGFKYDLRIPA